MVFTKKYNTCNVQRTTYPFFCLVDSDLPFFDFLFDNAKNDPVWYHIQVKQGDTVEKCYFPVFFKMVVFSSTGAGIWMKIVEMEENGI